MQITEQKISFRNAKTSKVEQIAGDDIEKCQWTRMGNKPALKLITSKDQIFRFGGFEEEAFDKIKSFAKSNWKKELESCELSVKGWNYGRALFEGPNLSFLVDDKLSFDLPLANVSNATAMRNEAVLELHRNDECTVALDSIRFHMPAADAENSSDDPVKEFVDSVLQHAGVVRDTDRPIVHVEQLLCTTPRGRYDVKVFPSHLSFHGKTFDYKIPIKTIMRLFLLPSKDGRHKYFVMGLDPPIRQGQTRYHYMVLEFANEDELDLSLALTDEQMAKYDNKLSRELSGPASEVVSRILRALTGQRITVPGTFAGHLGTPAVTCAYKSAAGLLYPLEKGFVFVHKPATYLRYDDVAQVFFDRSGAGVRSFDFEVQLGNGNVFTFNSIPKEEYTKLFDFMEKKKIRIRNKKNAQLMPTSATFAGSDDEIDPYKRKLQGEVEQREAAEAALGADSDGDESEEDSDYDPDKKEKAAESDKGSASGSGTEPDEEFDSDHASEEGSGSEGGSKPKKTKTVHEHKRKHGDKKSKKRSDKDKDPNAPKRPMSAYFLWLNDNRSKIKKEGMSVADVAKKAGELWKTITTEDKQVWEEKAAEEKKRYISEMKDYKAASGSSNTIKKPYIKSSGSAAPSGSADAKSKEYVSDSSGSGSDEKGKGGSKGDKGEKSESGSGSGSGSGGGDSD